MPSVTKNRLRKTQRKKVRNYFLALNLLEEKLKKKEFFSKEMILEVQAMVEKGTSKEKIGLRGPMPPGVLFAVYDSETGVPEYIPPEYIDIPILLEELVEYVNTTDNHPLIVVPMIQMSIMHRCKWDYLHCIIQEEKILLIRKFGLIIF